MSKTRKRGTKAIESFLKISDYMQKISQLETRIYELECENEKLKKQLEDKGINIKKKKKKTKEPEIKKDLVSEIIRKYSTTKKGEL